MENKKQTPKEDYSLIFEIKKDTKNFSNNELIYAIGINTFILFELIPKNLDTLKEGDKVYIGSEKREDIKHIKRVLDYSELDSISKEELEFTLIDLIDEKEEFFINFINRAQPISLRKNSLELIPGVGKKHLNFLLEEIRNKPFVNFEDVKERCSFLHNPQKSICNRIIHELEDKSDIKFFVRR